MDAVNNFLSEQSWTPNLRFISGYHDNDNYIGSISKSIEDSFSKNGKPDKLIFSYHGMHTMIAENEFIRFSIF